jgi:hypothetical protein
MSQIGYKNMDQNYWTNNFNIFLDLYIRVIHWKVAKIELQLRQNLMLFDNQLWAQSMNGIELIGGMDTKDMILWLKGCVTSVLDAKNDLNIWYKHLNNITISNP